MLEELLLTLFFVLLEVLMLTLKINMLVSAQSRDFLLSHVSSKSSVRVLTKSTYFLFVNTLNGDIFNAQSRDFLLMLEVLSVNALAPYKFCLANFVRKLILPD